MNRILGIDFGQSRIGLAVSDELRLLAHPLETIPAGKNAVQRIAEIVREKKIDNIVVGIPRNMDGSFGDACNSAFTMHRHASTCLANIISRVDFAPHLCDGISVTGLTRRSGQCGPSSDFPVPWIWIGRNSFTTSGPESSGQNNAEIWRFPPNRKRVHRNTKLRLQGR